MNNHRRDSACMVSMSCQELKHLPLSVLEYQCPVAFGRLCGHTCEKQTALEGHLCCMQGGDPRHRGQSQRDIQ